MIAAECGDAAACRRLIEAFLPAIANLARSFQGSRVERRELLQEGVAGLLFAARRYDSELETPFWAYASFWVRKAMQELVAELARPVALSDRAARHLSQHQEGAQRAPAKRRQGTHDRRTERRDRPRAGAGRKPARGRAHAARPRGPVERGRRNQPDHRGEDRRSRRRAGIREGARRPRDPRSA